jgi:hypothetical protein
VDENDKSVVAALLIFGGMSLIVGMMVTVPPQGSWLPEWGALFAGAGVLAGVVIVVLAAKWF